MNPLLETLLHPLCSTENRYMIEKGENEAGRKRGRKEQIARKEEEEKEIKGETDEEEVD